MTATNLTDTDLRARDAVIRRLDWDPDVDSSAVGVTAKNGVVTLTGFIDSHSGKARGRTSRQATARRVALCGERYRGATEARAGSGPDADITQDAARALELRGAVPETRPGGRAQRTRHAHRQRGVDRIRRRVPSGQLLGCVASAGSSITSRLCPIERSWRSDAGSPKQCTVTQMSTPDTSRLRFQETLRS